MASAVASRATAVQRRALIHNKKLPKACNLHKDACLNSFETNLLKNVT